MGRNNKTNSTIVAGEGIDSCQIIVLIMIVVDALRFDTACSHMGFMQHLVERKNGTL